MWTVGGSNDDDFGSVVICLGKSAWLESINPHSSLDCSFNPNRGLSRLLMGKEKDIQRSTHESPAKLLVPDSWGPWCFLPIDGALSYHCHWYLELRDQPSPLTHVGPWSVLNPANPSVRPAYHLKFGQQSMSHTHTPLPPSSYREALLPECYTIHFWCQFSVPST